MTVRRAVVRALNAVLEPFNVVIDSLTAERYEAARLAALDASGHFARPVFPVLPQFERCDPAPLLAAVRRFHEATAGFLRPVAEGEYSFDNFYFDSADAEIAYAIIRDVQPKTIVEIGSGNSTLLSRAAIADGELQTRLISIDPSPRRPIAQVADEAIALPAERVSTDFFAANLLSGDVLFVDSSHHVQTGTDVVSIILKVIPRLPPGVLIHFHDIFLPYDYPRRWVVEERWLMEEQYLVQAMLQESDRYEVLWPGYYFQRTLPRFDDQFHLPPSSNATSLWLRKLAGDG